ncbi:MAG: hypothetical protein K2K85_01285 [Clostridia bacterium]|nr:hypothetical protein [Clostridia bacterium]
MKNFADIIELCVTDTQGVNAIKTPFLINGKPIDFVTAPANRIYSQKSITLPFLINGVRHTVARKGCRPKTTLRSIFSFPGETRYLIKFFDGEVRLCPQLLSADIIPNERNGEIVAASDLKVNYIYLLLQGAGGGGAGSSSSTCGAGAGAGAMQIACINLDESWEIYCGKGGVGGEKSSNGANGEDTAAICVSSSLIARGGEGGQFNQHGGIGGDTYASENDMCHVILSVNGAMGSEVNSKGNGFVGVVSENYGDIEEDCSISFSSVDRASDAVGFHGGAGASSAFGKGGKGAGLAFNGGDADSYGGGGGGAGSSTPAKRGGGGGAGCVGIYY